MAVSAAAESSSAVSGRSAERGAVSTQASVRRAGVSTDTRDVCAGRPAEEDSEGAVVSWSTQQDAGQWVPFDGLQQEPPSSDTSGTGLTTAPNTWTLQSTRLRQRVIHVFMGNRGRRWRGIDYFFVVEPAASFFRYLSGFLVKSLLQDLQHILTCWPL